jgi:hypothetical protein
VRLDGGFANPAVLDLLDAEPNLEYVVAMAKNDPVTFCYTSLSDGKYWKIENQTSVCGPPCHWLPAA